MSESTGPQRDREQFWKDVVIPAARGLESFFWNLVWFAVSVCLLFRSTPFVKDAVMKIELRPLSEIKPYPNNPRVNDDAVEAVAASIREFGFRQPIVVDAENVIICGHTRFKAAQKLGLQKVPVQIAKDPRPEQIKAGWLVRRLNRPTGRGCAPANRSLTIWLNRR